MFTNLKFKQSWYDYQISGLPSDVAFSEPESEGLENYSVYTSEDYSEDLELECWDETTEQSESEVFIKLLLNAPVKKEADAFEKLPRKSAELLVLEIQTEKEPKNLNKLKAQFAKSIKKTAEKQSKALMAKNTSAIGKFAAEDLEQEYMLGIWEAAIKFDSSKVSRKTGKKVSFDYFGGFQASKQMKNLVQKTLKYKKIKEIDEAPQEDNHEAKKYTTYISQSLDAKSEQDPEYADRIIQGKKPTIITQEDKLIEAEEIEELKDLISKLKKVIDQQIISLVCKKVKYAEIANQLGLTENNVKVKVHRLTKKLAAMK